MTTSTAPKGLKFRQLLVCAYVELLKKTSRPHWYKAKAYLEERLGLLKPTRYQGTLTDRELGSWRVSAKLQLELSCEAQEETDWRRAFWDMWNSPGKQEPEPCIRRHTKLVPRGEHLKMKAGDLLRLLDAVEGR